MHQVVGQPTKNWRLGVKVKLYAVGYYRTLTEDRYNQVESIVDRYRVVHT